MNILAFIRPTEFRKFNYDPMVNMNGAPPATEKKKTKMTIQKKSEKVRQWKSLLRWKSTQTHSKSRLEKCGFPNSSLNADSMPFVWKHGTALHSIRWYYIPRYYHTFLARDTIDKIKSTTTLSVLVVLFNKVDYNRSAAFTYKAYDFFRLCHSPLPFSHLSNNKIILLFWK